MTSELQQQQSNSILTSNASALVVHERNTLPRNYEQRAGGQLVSSNVNNNNFVIVELHRDDHNCASFGFNIKGGVESGGLSLYTG